MDDVYEECFSYDVRPAEDSFNDTISNPATPLTPHTPCTPASDHDTDKSGFSVSLDSGIGSPSPFSMKTSSNHKIINVRSLQPMEKEKKTSAEGKASEHTNKEKHRRERIKDSCDQLRVLLPYIRGRKTDMASILEMAVDYLRIVNMCMPQALHDQIVEILDKDESLVPNKNNKSLRGKKGSKSAAKISAPPSGFADIVGKTPGSQKKKATKEMSLSDIANSCDIVSNKRPRIQTEALKENGPESFHLDARLEATLTGHSDFVPYNGQSSGLYNKPYTHHEDKSFNRMYSGNNFTDGYSTAKQIYNTYTSNKTSLIEANQYRPRFSTDSTLYHYYPNLVPNAAAQNHHYSSTSPSTDMINPNNVLSTLSYSRLENVTMLSDTANNDD